MAKKEEKYKPYRVFDVEEAAGNPEGFYKTADFNDLSKGANELEDIIYLGVGSPSSSSLPNPIVNHYIQLPEGTVANPSLSWALHNDTGFYLSGVATPGFTAVVDADEKTSWSVDGFLVHNLTAGRFVFSAALGLLEDDAAFTYSLSGDTTFIAAGDIRGGSATLQRFLWDYSDDSLSVYDTSGNQDIRIKANGDSYFNHSGNTGFGTTSPNSIPKVEIVQASATYQLRLTYAAGSIYTDISTNSNGYLMLRPSAGRVLMDLDFPGADVQFYIANADDTNTASHARLYLLSSYFSGTGGDPVIQFHTDLFGLNTSWCIGLDNSDSDTFKLSKSTNLGANDFFKVTVDGYATHTISTATTTPIIDQIQSSTGDSATRWAIGSTISYIWGIDNSVTGDPLVLSTAASGSAVLGTGDIVTITSSGQMGIGTGTLTRKLEVSNTGAEDGVKVISTTPELRLRKSNGSADLKVWDILVDTSEFLSIRRVNDAENAEQSQIVKFTYGGQQVLQTAANFALTKFNSQGTAWSSATGLTSLLFNGAAGDRPEISWYRGSRAYPEASIRQAVTADTGIEIWVGNGTAAPARNTSINVTGYIINDSMGAAFDFVVRGDNVSNLVVVDVSADKMGIGTAGPDRILDILDASNPQLRLTHTDGTVYSEFQTNSSGYLIFDNTGARYGFEQSSPQATVHITQATVGNEVLRFESTATNDDPSDRYYHGRAATTDATVTTINTIAVAASTTVMIEAHVRARRTGGTSGSAEDAAGYIIVGTYKNVAGTATLVGAVSADYTAEDQAGWDATLTASGGNVLLRVTGAANNNVTWHSTVRVMQVSS